MRQHTLMYRKLVVLCLMLVGMVLIVLGWTGVVGKMVQICGFVIFAGGGIISWGILSPPSLQPPMVEKKVGFQRDTTGAAISVSAALEQLANAGVRVRPGVSNDDLLQELGGTLKSPVDCVQLLCVLGSEVQRGEPRGTSDAMGHVEIEYCNCPQCANFEWASDDIWHFDTECIEDHGAYVTVLDRFVILAKGALPLTNVRDFVDIEQGKAWVEFTLDGSIVHWDLEVSDDWVDPKLYSRLQQLVTPRGAGKRFFIACLGQDSLVSFGDDQMRQALSRLSGLTFLWE